MWKRSYVATTVALGDTVDDALASIDRAPPAAAVTASDRSGPAAIASPLASPDLGAAAADLVAQLRAPQRATRAAALAKAVRDIVLAIDERTLR